MRSPITPVPAEEVAPWVEALARVGYAAKAILYITVGILAAQAALGRGGRTTDTDGALRAMYGLTLGRLILLMIAAGLVGYALWRLVEAIVDAEGRGSGPKGMALRVGSVARGLFHAGLGIAALRLAMGDLSRSAAGQPRYWTAWAFTLPGGELLVWLAAIGIAGYGGYQLYRAYAPKLALGMGIAFDGRHADFSRITGTAPAELYITRVHQKTFVDVNEEGTEAAAATAVGVGVTSAPPVYEMRVDRPFVFAIRERLSGTVLFLGVMHVIGE